MPRYYFVLRWPDQEGQDKVGTVLASDDDTLGHAKRVIRELKEDGGYDGPNLMMIVKDESGTVLRSIPFT
jgi:hypothetical protein